jgi:hypothetical protein
MTLNHDRCCSATSWLFMDDLKVVARLAARALTTHVAPDGYPILIVLNCMRARGGRHEPTFSRRAEGNDAAVDQSLTKKTASSGPVPPPCGAIMYNDSESRDPTKW